MKEQLAMVWTLIDNVQGLDVNGNPCVLPFNTKGWMPISYAVDAANRGEVELMAGNSMAAIQASVNRALEAREKAAGARKKRQYNRRDLLAEKA